MSTQFHYNTSKSKLVFREHGRNIQQLVDYCGNIEDPEVRNSFAKSIITLMAQMNPQVKGEEGYTAKLWHQMYAISDYTLDIDSPYPLPTKEEARKAPEKMDYPRHKIRFKHYGKNVEFMVEKAVTMEDPEKQMAYAKIIANYMKMVFRNWNRENVSDELIKNDLISLSNGVLDLTGEVIDYPKTANSGGYSKHSNNSGSRGKRKRQDKRHSSNNSRYGRDNRGDNRDRDRDRDSRDRNKRNNKRY